jgi:hypothetical protein
MRSKRNIDRYTFAKTVTITAAMRKEKPLSLSVLLSFLSSYNPNPEAVILKMVLADGSGLIQATRDLNLDARQHIARFVNESELFKDYFNARGEPFSGTLNLYLEDGRGFALIGLLLDRAQMG